MANLVALAAGFGTFDGVGIGGFSDEDLRRLARNIAPALAANSAPGDAAARERLDD